MAKASKARGRQRSLALLFTLCVSLVVLVSCGDGDEITATPTAIASPAIESAAARPPTQPALPCFVDLGAEVDLAPSASPTPQVVQIQLLEKPYRVIPNDVVLVVNREYRLLIQAGNEWHAFRVPELEVDFDIPPGGQAEVLVRPLKVGVLEIVNQRRMPESDTIPTITVVSAGTQTSTWHSLCGFMRVVSPPLGAAVSAPFVIEGSVWRAPRSDLQITRVEAWVDGEMVGAAEGKNLAARYLTNMDFRARTTHKDFYLTLPSLSPGTHTVVLQSVLQNGIIAASASMPVTVLPQASHSSLLPGYLGNVDPPVGGDLLRLPVTISGWVVVPGSDEGTGVGAVEIWNGPRETGQFLTEAVYGTYRPDVAESLEHPPFVSSGFLAELTNLPAGEVDIHVYVRDRDSGELVSPRFRQPPLTRQLKLAEGKVTDAAWPVALAAAPDGRLFFAELLTGNIRILQDGHVLPAPFATLADVVYHRESGLLGLALHPDFPEQPYVYAMYVVRDAETGFPKMQRVVRYRDVNNVGQDYAVILDELPFALDGFHNGGRIAFGPDGKLYLSIGDIWMQELSQDPGKLPGSILRFNPDGSIPADNPIADSPVYAFGFRNVFGLAFQPETGHLFATENGPGGFDEVNKVEAGLNYGWPLHMGTTDAEGFANPVAVYGEWPDPTVGPTGATFTTERPDLLLFCGFADFYLRGLALEGQDYTAAAEKMILSTNCALDVTYSNDGWLYYSTVSAIYRARLEDLLLLQE